MKKQNPLKNTQNTLDPLGEKGTKQQNVTQLTILSVVMLIAGIGSFYVYNQKNNESTTNISLVKSLQEQTAKINMHALTVQGQDNNFTELNRSKDNIDRILKEIQQSSLKKNFSSELNQVNSAWSGNKQLIDALLQNEEGIINIKEYIRSFSDEVQLLQNELQSIQQKSLDEVKKSQNVNLSNPIVTNELLFLSQRLKSSIDLILSAQTSSVETTYLINKDIKTITDILYKVRDGDRLFNIERTTDPELRRELNEAIKLMTEFELFAGTLEDNSKILSGLKEIPVLLNDSLKTIDELTGKLEDSIAENKVLNTLFLVISLALLLISMLIMAAISVAFKRRNEELSSLSFRLAKSQTNENKVFELVEQVETLSNNDYTNRIYSDDKFISPIATAIENTRVNFTKLVKTISSASSSMKEVTDVTEKNNQILTSVQQEQIKQIMEAVEKIGNITNEMDEVAQATWIAKEESEKSKQISKEGKNVVVESMHKMDEIRNTIQDSSKKIKKLGESAQAINEAVELIQNITKQINILALNAAIQAASSGESGKEFSIVAQEVQRLAFESQDATKKIESLIEEIQTDTASAISSMEKTTQEVVIGARLTDTLGSSLKQIEEYSDFVAEQVSNASSNIENKSIEMATIALEIQKVKEISNDTMKAVKSATEQTEKLKSVATEILDTVKSYKV